MGKSIYADGITHSPLRWKQWFLLPYKITHSTQLQNFMFRIAYRVIPTRVYLHSIRVVDDEVCTACQKRDDLLHFLCECPEVKDFWDSLATWMDANEYIMNFPENISEEDFLLGTISSTPAQYLFNYVTMCAKFYIYKNSVYGKKEYDLLQFLLELKGRLTVEKIACFADATYNRKFKHWESFYDSF